MIPGDTPTGEPAPKRKRNALGGIAHRAPISEHRLDLYDTCVEAVYALAQVEHLPHRILEPCCGAGNIVGVLRALGHHVIAHDLIDRGCPDSTSRIDFLLPGPRIHCDAVVTNPPFALASSFVRTALDRAPLVVMLLPLTFCESQGRADILDHTPPARIWCFADRLPRMHRAGWTGPRSTSSRVYCWFVWDRSERGPTVLRRVFWKRHRPEGNPSVLAAKRGASK
jgi:hypothetical protein